MTDKIKYLLISIAAILVLAGCDSGGSYNALNEEGAGYVLAGYYMMAGEEESVTSSGSSRATAPTWWDDYKTLKFSDVVAMGEDGLAISDYPEQGQITYITMTEADTVNKVYKVSSRTEYPSHDEVIDYYLEEYFLKNTGDDSSNWYDNGLMVSYDDDSSDWTENHLSRETMEVHFQDGSVREEWIAAVDSDFVGGTVEYAHFDIDGDMAVPTDDSWEPTAAVGMDWSSKVHYYQSVTAKIGWFSYENKEIFGVRYYTEGGGEKSSLAYETMISQTSTGWWGQFLSWIFGRGNSDGDATLAETVIRYEIDADGNKTTRSTSEIVSDTNSTTYTIDLETSY